MTTISNSRLFTASCFALAVTAMTFAIRAGILGQLGTDFGLTDGELGFVNAMAFLGFPIATIIGGPLYNLIGAKNLMLIAFASHLIGLLLTIFAGGFWTLLISTFFIGFANGAVEAGCNPIIADIYHKDKTTMLNRFHVWFPGGILIGALISFAMTNLGLSWKLQIAVMLVPTAIYGFMIFSKEFPPMRHSVMDTGANAKSMISPLFIFMALCMTLTATTELGTQQWIERVLGSTGAHPMLVLALMTGIMATGRFFAGPIVHALNPTGVLFGSSIIATAGIFLMSISSSAGMIYLSAILFALGVMYFWPTMIGFIAEYMPQTGAFGMSLIGGIGMFGLSIWNPIIGSWLDSARAEATANGTAADMIELVAGQATLSNLTLFPLALVVAFGILFFVIKPKKKEVLPGVRPTPQSRASV